jgi:hypothetical protein
MLWLRWTRPEINGDALMMLREKGLQKYSEVWTSDDHRLGVALRFYHRPEGDVEPALKLYASYLETQSIDHGGPVFVPTEFIADYDPATGRVTLSADLRFVENELWSRTPNFVARGRGSQEELPG